MVEQLAAWKSYGLLALIAGLIAVGLWTTIRSGVMSLSVQESGPSRVAVENLSRTVLMVALWLVALLAIQILVGHRLPWPR